MQFLSLPLHCGMHLFNQLTIIHVIDQQYFEVNKLHVVYYNRAFTFQVRMTLLGQLQNPENGYNDKKKNKIIFFLL